MLVRPVTELVSRSARNAGAPEQAWRTMIMSLFMASMFRAVSRSVSPFETLEVEVEILITSAESRLPASSKEVRVRVLAS